MVKIKGIKKYLPYIIVFVLFIAVAIVSFIFLNKKYKQPVRMKDIIVTSQDLGMYETLDDNKISVKKVPETTNTEGYFTERNDVVGKLAAFELKEGKPILKDFVIDKEEIKDIAFTTINVNYAQTGGAKPGDIVDVYRVNLDDKENWINGSEAEKVAEEVIVISLANSDGKTPETGSSIPLGGGGSKIEVVKLGVKDKYIKNIVPGSVNQENGYVLVVKKPFEKIISNINLEVIINEDNTEETDKNEKKEGNDIGVEKTTEKGARKEESEGHTKEQ